MIHPDRTGWDDGWNRTTTMGTEMITNFTAAARAQMDALLADAKGYEEKRAACIADAERLRMALVALGQTAPAVPTSDRVRSVTATGARKRKYPKNRAPGSSSRITVLAYASSVDTFTMHDVPGSIHRSTASNAKADGHLAVVGHKPTHGSIRPSNVYQITDKGRAWLAAHSKGAK